MPNDKEIDKEELKQTLDLTVEDLPPNSYRSKEHTESQDEKPSKEIKKVPIKGAVKKKSRAQRIKEAFFGEDVGSVSQYVFYDVLIPATKKLLAEMVNGAVNMTLFGDGRARDRDRGRTHVSMSSIYEGRSEGRYRRDSRNSYRSRLNDIIFDNRQDAEMVLERLQDLIDEYGLASLQDLYSLVGFDSTYTDNNWGWTNLKGAGVLGVQEGYVLDLPPVKGL